MSMHSQDAFVFIRPIQKHIIRSHVSSSLKRLDAHAHHIAVVYGVWVRISDFESCDAGADTIEAVLLVRRLFLCCVEDGEVEGVCVVCLSPFRRWWAELR